ncbi:MAG: hypothetical protein B7Z80_27465, partial [Rhodospirillales bacterium 20-64-7]
MRTLLALAAFTAFATAAQAETKPVVVELFTSLACSSCPPADALLQRLSKQPGILPLSFDVTYWNGPAFRDPYALKAATDRQAWYASLVHSEQVYTPEAVVDGSAQLVGSHAAEIDAAIAASRAAHAAAVPVSVSGGKMITITVQAGAGSGAELWLFGYDPKHTTAIGGGENGGASITEVNVVRSVTDLGGWTGQGMTMT